MTVRTSDNKVTKVLVMMDRVLRGIKGDDQGAEDRKEVEPKVLTNQLVTVVGDNRVEINWCTEQQASDYRIYLQEVCHARSEQDPRHDYPPSAELCTREGREGGFYQ